MKKSSSPDSWIPRRWIVGAALVLVAIAGLAIAKSSHAVVGYAGGLFLFGLATFGVFIVISTTYGRSPWSKARLFPAHGALRWALGAVVGVVAIAGLFHTATARPQGFGYYDGLGVFLAAIVYEFVLLKDWFDRRALPR